MRSSERSGPVGIGSEVPRVEDSRMVTGEARYVGDLAEPRMVHAAILRSQYAHARLADVDTTDAEAMDGVLAVLTADVIEEADVPTPERIPVITVSEVDTPSELGRAVIADRTVRYQGEPVAVVLAEDPYTAHDGVDAIDVSYERREPVVDPVEAIEEGAEPIHEAAPDNVAFEWELGDATAVDRALADAAATVSIDIDNQRIVQNPIEPRGALVDYHPSSGELTVEVTTQIPHMLRRHLATVLNYPANRIRVVAPDMGGGFGSRCITYPGEVLAILSAMYLERPVKWRATRLESYLSDAQGRGLETRGELALDGEGKITGLRVDVLDDLGAYVSTFAEGCATVGTNVITGQYDIPDVHYHVTGALTNTTPTDAYRGVAEVELIHLLERLMRLASREIGVDPADLRRKNFVEPDQFPYEAASGACYDSGRYQLALDRALDIAGYEDLRAEQRALREEDRYLGVGLSAWIEKCGSGCGSQFTAWEYSNVQVHPSGEVEVYCGTSNHGQGHETTYAQIVAGELGIPIEDVSVVEDDTDRVREGVGTFASRSAPIGGSAIKQCVDGIRGKARAIAAHDLEADPADLEFEDGEFTVRGAPDRSLTIQDVAELAHVGAPNLPEGIDPGLEATDYYDPPDYTFPFGFYVAVVEVDPGTGEVEFRDFVAVDDCGEQINPTIVEGQVHGGIAQGVGQALYEGAIYDDSGTLTNASHMDYTVPKAEHVPGIETDYTVTPSPRNPLGVKGVGESGVVGALPATVNAVEDALAPFDVDPMTPPLTPEKLWRAVTDADQ